MKVLVLGSGGREHALGWKISQSPLVDGMFFAPGNAGTSQLGINLEITVGDFEAIRHAIQTKEIELVVIGPEDPLVNGLTDYLKQIPEFRHVKIIGPTGKAAMLEGSKEFAKEFMKKYNIPTASYESFGKDDIPQAMEFLGTLTPPYVLKADGLAAGKGVLILDDLKQAGSELQSMLEGKFGEASNKVVIEEFLDGIEISAFVITDGKDYILLPEAKDYKRVGEGDTGLNTGGMGAVSPVPFADNGFLQKVEGKVIKPTIDGIAKEGFDYSGFLFFGLINVKGEPYVIEYNVRMGDPETEVVMPRIKSDLVPALIACAEKSLEDVSISFDNRAAATVMMVSGGYPESYEKGKPIQGLEGAGDSVVFHAGTKIVNGEIHTNGGRVLSITSYGDNFREALEKSYETAEKIEFDKRYYRRDIGFDL